MEKSVKINLSGNLFQIDRDAYDILQYYLGEIEKRLKNSPGSKETMDDLEMRIAEIFDSMSGSAGMITKDNVEAMMGIIGSPADFETGEPYHGTMTFATISKKSNPSDRGSTGKVFGDIFGAIGKVFYVIFRIVAIFIGLCMVLIGFTFLMVAILTLFIKNTGFLPVQLHGNFFYLPDFLGFVVSPSLSTWVSILTAVVIILPLLALIYWGIKLVFWFRARDGVFSLVALIVWVISISALTVIISGQGLNFSRDGRSVSTVYLKKPPHDLYIVTGKKISDLKYNSDLRLPDDAYSLYANTETHELYVKARLRIRRSDDSTARIEIVKTSAGEGYSDASRRAEQLPACSRLSNDTLYMDEYFALPAERRWSADMISTDLYLPENTIIHFDQAAREVLCTHCSIDGDYEIPDSPGNLMKVTPGGLKYLPSGTVK